MNAPLASRSPERLRWNDYFEDSATPFTVRRARLDGGFKPHDHEFWEAVLVVGGSGLHQSVYGETRIGRGDVFFLRPGVWHAYRNCRGLDYYNCCLGSDLLTRELAWVSTDPALSALFWGGADLVDARQIAAFRLSGAVLKSCEAHLDAIEACQKSGLSCWAERIGHLLLFFAELARRNGEVREGVASAPQRAHPAVLRAIELLQRDPSGEWTLSTLAGAVHLAPAYLVRRFKTMTGLTPMHFLTRIRVERAAAMLGETGRSIGEIAATVGWPDQNYFARRFRAHFGLSASEYRERCRAKKSQ